MALEVKEDVLVRQIHWKVVVVEHQGVGVVVKEVMVVEECQLGRMMVEELEAEEVALLRQESAVEEASYRLI